MAGIAAIVLTYNEECHIRDCLESLTWCDEVWIVDSGSTDNTLDICMRYTQNIVKHPFISFFESRNWALNNLPICAEWVLFVDSDERITPELQKEIIRTISTQRLAADGYYIPMKQYFWGQWLKHGEAWPNYVLRLFRKRKAYYSNHHEVHEYVKLWGKVGFLRSPFIHISRSSMSETLAKLNFYTTLDAIRMYRTGEGLYPAKFDDSMRKRILKGLFNSMPFKPQIKFVWDYVILQGFRDGYIGLIWARIQALYVSTAYIKLWELRRGLVNAENLQHRVSKEENDGKHLRNASSQRSMKVPSRQLQEFKISD
ncbi:MAG TPA: glycosyltransferase family 2 protein [Candidatus Bathyarchaeia archaeon]|nr:glycosyltransferase family 2 protein [Candidatus Bathyarchaeia archaeon]